MKAAKQYDIPAIVGDGMPLLCCPSGSSVGTCSFELGAEVQTLSVTNEDSTVAVGNALFDSGAVRLMYLGGQSKSIRVKPPQHDGVTTIQIDPSADLPVASPIAVGDVIKIADNSYVISNVDAWPHAVEIEGGFASSSSSIGSLQTSVVAYFDSPPTSCFDVGSSADNLRDYLLEGFDDSPFGESLAVSREIVTRFVGELGEIRVVGYLYHVTFLGQGFSSALGGGVDEFLILSSGPGDCSPFLSDGVDVSSHVNVTFSTNVDAGRCSSSSPSPTDSLLSTLSSRLCRSWSEILRRDGGRQRSRCWAICPCQAQIADSCDAARFAAKLCGLRHAEFVVLSCGRVARCLA